MGKLLKNIFIDLNDDHYYLIQRFKCPVHISLFREINVHTYFYMHDEEKIKKYLERIEAINHFSKQREMEGFYIFVDENEKGRN